MEEQAHFHAVVTSTPCYTGQRMTVTEESGRENLYICTTRNTWEVFGYAGYTTTSARKDLPISAISVGLIAATVLLAFFCWKWRRGPLFVVQVWLLNLRTILIWLRQEALGGIVSRWPRYPEILERVRRGEV